MVPPLGLRLESVHPSPGSDGPSGARRASVISRQTLARTHGFPTAREQRQEEALNCALGAQRGLFCSLVSGGGSESQQNLRELRKGS